MPRRLRYAGEREIAPDQFMVDFEDESGKHVFSVPRTFLTDKRGSEIVGKQLAGGLVTADERNQLGRIPGGYVQYTGPRHDSNGQMQQTYSGEGADFVMPGNGPAARQLMRDRSYDVLPGPSLEEMQGRAPGQAQVDEAEMAIRHARDQVDMARMMYQQKMRDQHPAAPAPQYDVEIGQPVVNAKPQYAVEIGNSEPSHLSALRRLRRQLGLED